MSGRSLSVAAAPAGRPEGPEGLGVGTGEATLP